MARLLALFVLLVGCTTVAACGTERERNPPAGNPSAQRLDGSRIPEELRHLVPIAERWGIGDDVDRNAKVDGATAAEREELRAAIEPRHARITAWLDSFGQGQMSDEAAAFMYTQLALEEMTAGAKRP